MTDVDSTRKKIAQLLRMLGSRGGERRNAFAALERTMQSAGVSWSDIGNMIEPGKDPDKYSEEEMQEFAQAARADGVEAGIKIGMSRAKARSSSGNGHLVLPAPVEMAEFCQARRAQLKDDNQREFVDDMVIITRRHRGLSLGRLGYLASIYIQHGGRI
jgi:hypothetical protein